MVKFYGTSLLKRANTSRVILVMEKCRENLKSHIFDHPEATPVKTEKLAVIKKVQYIDGRGSSLKLLCSFTERGLFTGTSS